MLMLYHCLCICFFQDINVVIIIIIIRHQLDSVWPHLLVSSQVFAHLVYNLLLFLASCCCSFLLRVFANLICISFVSGQLVLLSSLSEYLHSFLWSQKGVPHCSSENILICVMCRVLMVNICYTHCSSAPQWVYQGESYVYIWDGIKWGGEA